METTSISSATTGATAASGTTSNELEDQFLQLLVAQLKNQDPLSPMENEEFVSELAQLQALDQQEQLTRTNAELLLQSSLATGASLIGKEISGIVTVAGQNVQTTGVVQSVRVEAGNVLYQTQLQDGSTVSMASGDLISVQEVPVVTE
jgi:flagellar basal-body rod modification protein FlgD